MQAQANKPYFPARPRYAQTLLASQQYYVLGCPTLPSS